VSGCSDVTAPTAIYSLSLHDALPICEIAAYQSGIALAWAALPVSAILELTAMALFALNMGATYLTAPEPLTLEQATASHAPGARSEEHTSELQSRENLVCRLLLEKKK